MMACALAIAAIGISGCKSGDQKGTEAMKLTRPVPVAPGYPEPRVEAPDRLLREKAIAQIQASCGSRSAFSRAHAIEAAKNLPPDLMRDVVIVAVQQRATVVRFAALMTAGEMRVADITQYALKLVDDPDKSVQAGAIFALHRLGDKRFSHRLEVLSVDSDRQIRANTSMLLGILEEPSAARILRHQMRDSDPVVRLQAAEGLWRLHDQDALTDLVSSTISRYPDDQMIAALALAAPRDPRVVEHLRGMLTTPYPEVNLVAARAIGQLGLDEGYGVAMKAMTSDDPRQRQLAALALGAIGRIDSQQALGKLLLDTYEDVRLAASSALLQLR